MRLEDLRQLAARYCPTRPFSENIFYKAAWGPGHELAHTLLATPEERRRAHFGLTLWHVTEEYALRVEAAAMRISFRLHAACGEHRLIVDESEQTDDSPLLHLHKQETIELMRERGCLGVPRSIGRLEELCRQRGLRPVQSRIVEERLRSFTSFRQVGFFF